MSGFMMMSMNNQRVVSAAAPAPPPSAAFVTSGLVTYLDAAPSGVYPTKYEGVGYDNSGVWRDQVGSSDITLANSPPYDSSTNGGQFTFNLNNDAYSDAAQHGYGAPGSAINTSEMTVEIWYNSPPGITGVPQVPVISSNLDSLDNAWMIHNSASGRVAWNRLLPAYLYSGTFIYGGGYVSLSANIWYQIIFRKTGGNMYISYYNGSSYISNASWPYNYLNSSPESLVLMAYYSGNLSYRGGKLAIVRIYNTALSDADLLTNYNATKARFGLT